jgi:hypothetical protein
MGTPCHYRGKVKVGGDHVTVKEQLYEKLSAEYAAFIDALKDASPDKIIDSAYEKVFKEDILSCFEYGDSFSEKQIAALLALEYPLDGLYFNWLDTDVSHMDDLSDTIHSFATREMQEQSGIDGEEIAEADENVAPSVSETPKAQAINGELYVGDYVIVVPNDDYGYLVGQVKAIGKLGTPEHDTENSGDDIHVDFTVFSYPPWQQNDFAEHFNEIFDYDEYKNFTELTLDDVIIAPDAIIGLTGISDEKINDLVTDAEFAQRFCNQILQEFDVNRKEQLIERINNNYADFVRSLLSFDTRELIEVSGKISAMQYAHRFLTAVHDFEDVELQYYLQFQNPLEVVADDWYCRNLDLHDFRYSIYLIYEVSDDVLKEYPLMKDIDTFADYPIHHRYMSVDLTRFLGEIAGKVIIHNPEDWQSQRNALYRIADTENPENKRLVWMVSSRGAQMYSEQATFIKGTPAFDKCVDYRSYDPNMFGYIVEVTGKSGDVVIGNVFEVGDFYAHTMHIKENALICTEVSLTYSNDWGVNAGKTITIPRFEYDDDRHRLMSESGNVTSIQYHPYEAIRTMSDVLQQEHSRRMAYPIGSQQAHLKTLSDKLAEIRETQEPERPPDEKKRSLGDRIAAGNEKVKAYKKQKAQNPVTTTKNKEDIIK